MAQSKASEMPPPDTNGSLEDWGPSDYAAHQRILEMITEGERAAQEYEEAYEDPEGIDWDELDRWDYPRE